MSAASYEVELMCRAVGDVTAAVGEDPKREKELKR